MTVIDDNPKGTPIMSRNASDIRIESAGDTSIFSFKVSVFGVPDAEVGQFVPLNGEVAFRMKEILSALPIRWHSQEDLPDDYTTWTLPKVMIHESSDSDSLWESYVIVGGIDESHAADMPGFYASHWLTWRPQISDTFRWGKEYLSLVKESGILHDGRQIQLRCVYARLYMAMTGEKLVWCCNLYTVSVPRMLVVNVSYSNMKRLAEAAGYDDEILAYDVWVRNEFSDGTVEDNVAPRRYIVKKDDCNVTEFVFLNALMAFDTVYAYGTVKRNLSHETVTFSSDGVEQELENSSVESWEVNTGHIGSERMMSLWIDFLASAERYVCGRDGRLCRIVVEEADSESQVRALGHATFTFHYAEKPAGRYYEDKELDTYSYDTAEFQK